MRFFLLTILFPAITWAVDSPPQFQWGLELGETPLMGSSKIGINGIYRFNSSHALMTSWQFPDDIRRDNESFNANDIPAAHFNLGQLQKSEESTGHRAQVLMQFYPTSGPWYLTYGILHNDTDKEKISFNNDDLSSSKIIIRKKSQTTLGVGIGIQWQGFGSQWFVQWSGSLMPAPEPHVEIHAQHLNINEQKSLTNRIQKDFTSRITNRTHLFSLGIYF